MIKDKTIAILCYCDNEQKIEILIENIDIIKRKYSEFKIAIQANYPLPEYIQRMVDYYFYEDINHVFDNKTIKKEQIIDFFNKKFIFNNKESFDSYLQLKPGILDISIIDDNRSINIDDETDDFIFTYEKNENKLKISTTRKIDAFVNILHGDNLIFSTQSHFNNNRLWYSPSVKLYNYNKIIIKIFDLNNILIKNYCMEINEDLIKPSGKTKCFIINYNRLTLMSKMADYLYDNNIDVYIIDNNSTYEPLLEYYKNTKYNVIRMEQNYGHDVFWKADIFKKLNINERFLLTDSDLDISEIPNNFLDILNEGLDKYPEYDKCGFSLDIFDLPVSQRTNEIMAWETKFWVKPLDDMYYLAGIDTTFALYKTSRFITDGIRTNKPYCAKHVPWYYTDYDSLPDDEKYYFDNVKTLTHWSKKIREL